MTIDQLYRKISHDQPAALYIGGKTSTGKSTFTHRLRDELGYNIVELEAQLVDVIKADHLPERETYKAVFNDKSDSQAKQHFFAACDHAITTSLTHQPTVIEGSVANIDTLRRALQAAPHCLMIYFCPDDLDVYIRNLTARCMAINSHEPGGLPSTFWRLIDDAEFKTFRRTRVLSDSLKQTIRKYALESQRESEHRLHELQQHFDDIILVQIQ